MPSTMYRTQRTDPRSHPAGDTGDELLSVTRAQCEDGGANGVRIIAVGELDLCSAPLLATTISDAATSADVIELDLAGVTFIDSQGVHLLRHVAEFVGRSRARLVGSSPAVDRLFRMLDLPLPL